MKFLLKANLKLLRPILNIFLVSYLLIIPLLLQANPLPDGWILDASVSGVTLYHKFQMCNGKNVVFLKFENKNNYPVKVSWKEIFTTQEGVGIEGYFGPKSIIINTGEVSETNCQAPLKKELIILPEQVWPTYIAIISKFEFKDINIAKA